MIIAAGIPYSQENEPFIKIRIATVSKAVTGPSKKAGNNQIFSKFSRHPQSQSALTPSLPPSLQTR